MSTRIGIVWNPSKVDGDEIRDAFARAVDETALHDSDVHWFETTESDPGGEAAGAALAAGCGLVIAAGGDGTVRAVAERLGAPGPDGAAGSDAELGIVPLGTGNLLARNLGVPLGDARAAFVRALTEEASPLDLGEVTFVSEAGDESTQGFVVMAGFGIDAQMIAETDDELKAKAGWLAYVESLGRAAAGTEVVDFDLAVDGGEARLEQAHTLLIANCGALQGGVTLMPDARPDDGELDLLVLRAADAVGWLDAMRNMAWDNGLKRLVTGADAAESSASTGRLRARTVRVSLSVPLEFEIDGDEVGAVSAFEARVFPGALSVR
ncbi:diacylglycerol kinase [Leucobacter zeae]|nr:diacylglycerol kinase [Leucobacter zeae]